MSQEPASDEWEVLTEYAVELPVDGSQDSPFHTLGIEFGPFERGDKLRMSNLPKGWTIEYSEPHRYHLMVDDRDRARVRVHNKGHVHMRIIPRFSISRDVDFGDVNHNARFCLWDANVKVGSPNKVRVDKEYTLPSRKRHPKIHEDRCRTYEAEARGIFIKWLQEHYPKWEDDLAHWDEDYDTKIDESRT